MTHLVINANPIDSWLDTQHKQDKSAVAPTDDRSMHNTTNKRA